VQKLDYANTLALTDSIGAQSNLLRAVLGAGGAGTVSYGANQNSSRILALVDPEQVNALLPYSEADYKKSLQHLGSPPFFTAMIQALNSQVEGLGNHIGLVVPITLVAGAAITVSTAYSVFFNTGDYVTFYDTSESKRSLQSVDVLTVNNTTGVITLTGAFSPLPGLTDYLILWDRLCPEFAVEARANGASLTGLLVFPPITALGQYDATGAPTGTFTDGSAVDTDFYGDADCEVTVLVNPIGGNDLVLAITGTNEDGDVITGAVTVPTGTLAGVSVDIVPTVTGERFADITAVTNSNGTAGDSVSIQTKLDRVISL